MPSHQFASKSGAQSSASKPIRDHDVDAMSTDSEAETFEVECILDDRWDPAPPHAKQYFVKWLDHGEEDNSWEPLAELKINCSEAIRQYKRLKRAQNQFAAVIDPSKPDSGAKSKSKLASKSKHQSNDAQDSSTASEHDDQMQPRDESPQSKSKRHRKRKADAASLITSEPKKASVGSSKKSAKLDSSPSRLRAPGVEIVEEHVTSPKRPKLKPSSRAMAIQTSAPISASAAASVVPSAWPSPAVSAVSVSHSESQSTSSFEFTVSPLHVFAEFMRAKARLQHLAMPDADMIRNEWDKLTVEEQNEYEKQCEAWKAELISATKQQLSSKSKKHKQSDSNKSHSAPKAKDDSKPQSAKQVSIS